MNNELYELIKKVEGNANKLKIESERRLKLELLAKLMAHFERIEYCPIKKREIRVYPGLSITQGRISVNVIKDYTYNGKRRKNQLDDFSMDAFETIATTNVDISRFKNFLVEEALPRFINGEKEISFDYVIPKGVMEKRRKRNY